MFPVLRIDFDRYMPGDPAKFWVYMWHDEPPEEGIQQDDVFFPGDALELMQYTGLHDKNGKEIWEGDILISKSGIVGPIEWEEYDSCFVWTHSEMVNIHMSEGEVIGNIYKNPELVEAKS